MPARNRMEIVPYITIEGTSGPKLAGPSAAVCPHVTIYCSAMVEICTPASFSSDNFTVSSGAVTVTSLDGGTF